MNALNLNESAPRLDRVQLAAIAGLMLVGVVFVYSATFASEAAALVPLLKQLWLRQLFWYGCGLAAAAACCFVNYHTLSRWAFIAYWVTIAWANRSGARPAKAAARARTGASHAGASSAASRTPF